MKKVYKYFFNKLESTEMQYFDILAEQYTSNEEKTILLFKPEHEDFFHFLEFFDLIANIKIIKINISSTIVYYYNTMLLAQFLKYYTENFKNKSN